MTQDQLGLGDVELNKIKKIKETKQNQESLLF